MVGGLANLLSFQHLFPRILDPLTPSLLTINRLAMFMVNTKEKSVDKDTVFCL